MAVHGTERARYGRRRDAVAGARRQARTLAGRWGFAGVADDVVGVVGELVANAVVHGRTGRGSYVEVSYRMAGRRLRIEVRDAAGGVPEPREADELAEDGRGLAIVAALSARWGVERHVVGKSVWCEIGEAVG